MTTAVKRACDACHRRKVKCDGINPCRNCSASQLACTYNAIPQKKGPKGSRAKVISELRETQRQTSLSAKIQNRLNGINSPPSSPPLAPTPGLLSNDMIKECIDFFFANMYPSMPILHRERLEQQLLFMDGSLDTYCLLTSMCAFMMLQPGMPMPGGDPFSFESMPGAHIVSSSLLLEETLRVRKGYDYLESPSLNTLCTSYFLFCCYYGLDLHDKAWFHLREATTLAHMIGMNKETTYMQYDRTEASGRRRLYWLLFVTERAYALQRRRPLTLEATINLPTSSDDHTDPLAHQLGGFIQQVNLFRSFDNVLVPLWNKTRDESGPFLASLQKQLDEALPSYLNDMQTQFSELQINQQWIKNTTWQLSVASGNGSDYPFPIDIARDLLPMAQHLPGNLGFHGLALIEKLLGVTHELTEVLAMQPATRIPFTVGPREQLHQILNVVTVLRSGDYRLLPLLLSKVHDFVPKLANPMLQSAPENTATVACNIDIFDGFGNAGMGQPAMFAGEDYDNKFAPVARMDDMSPESGSPNGAPSSNNDMNSPFVSSPPIMSPGMDMQHGMPSDFTSMPEMVMSPMSHAPPPSMSTPGTMNGQTSQHAPHHSMGQFQNLNPQMQNLNASALSPAPNIGLAGQMPLPQGLPGGLGNGMNNGLGQNMNANNLIPRPQPQRSSTFAMGPQQIRTVADFQALQRANSDMGTLGSLGMGSMTGELDFNTLPR